MHGALPDATVRTLYKRFNQLLVSRPAYVTPIPAIYIVLIAIICGSGKLINCINKSTSGRIQLSQVLKFMEQLTNFLELESKANDDSRDKEVVIEKKSTPTIFWQPKLI